MNLFLHTLKKFGTLVLILTGFATYGISADKNAPIGTAVVSETDIQNPEFDNGTSGWTLTDQTGPGYSNGGSSFSVVQGAGLSGTNSLYIDVVNTNTEDYLLSVKQLLNFDLEAGKTYRISFMAKGQSVRDADVSLSGNGSNNGYWYQDLTMTTSAQTFSFDFECTDSNVSNEPSFTLSFYLAKGVISDVWLDKISIEDITGRVRGVQISPSDVVLNVGQTWQLNKDVFPEDALNPDASWTSKNTDIATVNSAGLVTAVSPGLCVVTATTNDGGYMSSAVVFVPIPGDTPIQNGEFDQGTMSWSFYDETGPDYSYGGGSYAVVETTGFSGSTALRVDVANNSTEDYLLRLKQLVRFRFEEGRKYRISFMAKGESARDIDVVITGEGTHVGYRYETFGLTTTPQLFTYEFLCVDPDVNNEPAFAIEFFMAKGVISDVWLDKVLIEDITGIVTGVDVSPEVVSILPGQTWQLDEVIEPYDAVNMNVQWSSSNTNVATVSNIGLVTAVAPGSAAITVTTQDGGYTSTALISVPTPGVASITNGEFDDGLTNWMLEDESGPDYSNGGTTFSVVQGAGLSGSNALKVDIVNDNDNSWHLRLRNRLNFRLELGQTYRVSFKAKAQSNRELHYSIVGNGSQVNYWYETMDLTTSPQDYDFEFTCSDTGVLSEPSFSFNLYLALGVISDVWIDKVMIENITGRVTGIEISPSVLSLKQGQTWQMSSEIQPSDAINQNISWTSSNAAVASVSSTGLVTAISFGSATITATTVDGGYASTSNVTVIATGNTSLQNPEFDLGLTNWTLRDMTGPDYSDGGTTYSVVQNASMSGANALRVDIVNADNENWHLQVIHPLNFRIEYGKTYRISFMAKAESARDMEVALVGEGTHVGYCYERPGMTTAAQTFTYTYTCDNTNVGNEPSFSLVFFLAEGVIKDVWIDKVTVEDISSVIPVTAITVTPSALTLPPGGSVQLGKSISPANATNQDVTWSSTNTSVASVNGLGFVTAVATGSATITATTVNGGFTSQSTVTVSEGQLASGYAVAWNNLLGVTDNSAYILTKTGTTGWNNAGAFSENQLPAAQNGWVEFKVDNSNTNGNYLAGFSTTDNSYLRSSIEYGLEINPTSNRVLVHESSDSGIDIAGWAVGDIFRISREGDQIKYYKNGFELRTVATDANKAYTIKALINVGKTYPTITSFWIPAGRGQVPDAWEFVALKDLYNSTNGPSWTNKTSWGTPNNWATNITAAQMDGWFGVTTASGDITSIVLQSNNLTGEIPESIGKLKGLRWLYLDNNHLQGVIPTTIGMLTLLDRLILSGNDLTGSLPSSLGNLTSLQYLSLNGNDLTGNFDWLGSLVNMIRFSIQDNPNLSCTIPSSIGNLTKMTSFIAGGFLGDRNYVKQKLHGTIPATIANCTKLEYLYVDNSELSGQVPDIHTLTNLKGLVVFNNPQLEGDLPTMLNGLTKLTIVYVFNTSISGNMLGIDNSLIVGYDVSGSNVRGTVPTLPNAVNMLWIGLDDLEIAEIPNWGTSFTGLWYLSVKNNLLSTIPNFSNHPNKANLELYIQDNELDFTEIEANFTGAGVHPFKTFVYAPQRNPEPVTPYVTVMANQEIRITAPSGGVHGVYLWEKKVDGNWTSVNMLNQSGVPNQFIRSSGAESDEGTYRYTVSNTWVPGLTFQSGPIEVAIGDAPASSVKPLYNGLITSMRWRTDKTYGTQGSDYEGMYVFDYDDKYQIQDASWATPNTSTSSISMDNTFRLTGMEYDPNGNIQALKRYDANQNRVHNFNYQYAYSAQQAKYNNKLSSVDGYVDNYSYNKLGQLVGEEKENGEKQYLLYDVTGKVRKVYSEKDQNGNLGGLKAEYLYDDRGFRMAKLNFEEDRTTWYVRDASGNVISIYTQPGVENQTPAVVQEGNAIETSGDDLSVVEVPVYGSGKMGTYYPGQDGSMSYEITDHLGNVRALVRDDIMVFTATMEDNGSATDKKNPRYTEKTWFQNIEETEKDDVNMNHTPETATTVTNPSRSAYLYWQDGVSGIEASDKATGPAIALAVGPGDIIKAETFVRYENKLTYSRDGITLGVLSSLLGGSFGSVLGFDGYSIPQTAQLFNNALGAGSFLGDGDDTSVPFAYLSYIVFDEDMVRIASDRIRVSEDAGFDPPDAGLENQHEQLKFEEDIVIGENGKYIYLWVSNESEATKVWFDDFSVTHLSNFVAQATDYGVWGDVLREQKSEWLDRYRFGYQGQFAEKDDETGWNHFELREYDPVIGRWTTTDPLRQYYSPYNGNGNNPISNTDPTGGFNPIYGSGGTLRGVDEFGLQGEAIVYDGAFTNGMKQSEILAGGGTFLSKWKGDAWQTIHDHWSGLSNRPDWDGFITITEGVDWAKSHPNALNDPYNTPENSLYINAATLDFGNISASDFNEVNKITRMNLFNKSNTFFSTANPTLRGTVYALGRVHMILIHRENKQVTIVNDAATDYDWNPGGGRTRDTFIKSERALKGLNDSHGFGVYYYGIGTLNK